MLYEVITLLGNLDEPQMQRMLQSEHGGMNEVLADLYALTGDSKYLKAAERFCHHEVLEPVITSYSIHYTKLYE